MHVRILKYDSTNDKKFVERSYNQMFGGEVSGGKVSGGEVSQHRCFI